MTKRIISSVIILFIFFSSLNFGWVQAKVAIDIGDYVQMGKYYNEPILWRCVDIDKNGPLMLSDKIISIKPFDARGTHNYPNKTPQTDAYGFRTSYGSNLWETSNIRCWLNATSKGEKITWLDNCPPDGGSVESGYNAYVDEKGFLSNGNFTSTERNSIKNVTQKSILNVVDKSMVISGKDKLVWDFDISTVARNFDDAYSNNVTEKVFLLDVSQLSKVYQNSNILSSDYFRAKPTEKAIENSMYRDRYLASNKYWAYWLRSPDADESNPYSIRSVGADGDVVNGDAQTCSIGIRPAFYLNLMNAKFKGGNGSLEKPFVVGAVKTFDMVLLFLIVLLVFAGFAYMVQRRKRYSVQPELPNHIEFELKNKERFSSANDVNSQKPVSSNILCSKCGAEIASGMKFCPSCGNRTD